MSQTRASQLLNMYNESQDTSTELLEGKSQVELIEYYTKQLHKVLKDNAPTSQYAHSAFFMLQAINMGMSIRDAGTWASKEVDRLHDIAVDNA